MKTRLLGAAAAALMFAAAAPASAQMTVTDPGAYVRMLRQLNEARAQLQELQTQVRQGTELISQGQRLYDDFNKLTNVNSLAGVLNNPALRRYLPAEVQDTSRLLNGTLSDLGSIGTRASSIRDANRLFTPVRTLHRRTILPGLPREIWRPRRARHRLGRERLPNRRPAASRTRRTSNGPEQRQDREGGHGPSSEDRRRTGADRERPDAAPRPHHDAGG